VPVQAHVLCCEVYTFINNLYIINKYIRRTYVIITFVKFILFFSNIACETSEPNRTDINIDEKLSPEKKQIANNIKAESSQEFLGLTKARTSFPSTLASYRLDKIIKQKNKSEVWKEYSATYKNNSSELKVVINEHVPDGNPEWQKLFSQSERKTKEYNAAFSEKNGKSSWMVRVGSRFRVDFKSKTESESTLKEISEKFNYAPLLK